MKCIKLVTIVAILLLNTLILLSQDDALQKYRLRNITGTELNLIPREILDKSDSFFSKLTRKQIDSAYDELLKTSPLGNKADQVAKLKTETIRSLGLYGDLTGYELVSSELASASLLKLRYLALHTRFPMRWMMTFYKSAQFGWIIINITFDDNIGFFFTDE